MAANLDNATGPDAALLGGVCHALFAFDVGQAIDLDMVERLVSRHRQRETIRQRRRAPQHFQFEPPPLRISEFSLPVEVGRFVTQPTIDLILYDFGSISVAFALPLRCGMDELLDLSNQLYENPALQQQARRHVDEFLNIIAPAVTSAGQTPLVEDYAIFMLDALPGPVDSLLREHAALFARILRSEAGALSSDEIGDAISARISYTPDDLTLVDWNAALVFGKDADDVRSVLEFANVELLEMRHLDGQLDRALDQAYVSLVRRRWAPLSLLGGYGRDLRRIARLQADSAVLFEGVNNALKLIGDQYLARLYRLASLRLHLPEWDASILRKLQTLESIYEKVTDQANTRRMELLEWIIILLIAVSMILPLVH